MKKMKRILSVFLALALVFSLTACKTTSGTEQNQISQNNSQPVENNTNNQTTPASNEIKPEEGAQLVAWESSGQDTDVLKEIAAAFTAKYGVPVTVESVEAPDARERMSQDGPAGTGADVFAAPHDHTGALVSAGLVNENIFVDDMKKTIIPAALQAVTIDNKIYGYPKSIETYVLFYNKDIYKKAPTSWNDIIEMGKTYTNVKENKFAFIYDVGNAYYSISWVFSKGGYIFGNNETNKDDVGLDSAGAIAGMNELLKLKDVFPVKAEDCGWDTFHGLFLEGKNAAMINGPWALKDVRDKGINYELLPLPTLADGTKMKSFSGVRPMFVSAYSKYPNAAALFAKFVASHEMQMKAYEVQGRIPVSIEAKNEKSITDNKDAAAFLAQAENSIPMPSIPQVGLFWGPTGAALATIWNGQVSAEEGMKTAAKTLRDAIAEQN